MGARDIPPQAISLHMSVFDFLIRPPGRRWIDKEWERHVPGMGAPAIPAGLKLNKGSVKI